MNALVIGGTGATGPTIIEGLLDRGYAVTIFHSGQHEVSFTRPVEHIHGDAHFAETIDAALGRAPWLLAALSLMALAVWIQTRMLRESTAPSPAE